MLVLIEMQRYYRLGAVQIATQTHCRSCAAAMPSISWVRRRLRRILEDLFQSRHIHFIFHRRMHSSRNTKCSGGRVEVRRVDCAGNARNCTSSIPPARDNIVSDSHITRARFVQSLHCSTRNKKKTICTHCQYVHVLQPAGTGADGV